MEYKYKILLLLFWTLVSSKILLAQQSPTPFLLEWTEKDGLSDNYVNTLLKDKRGWLWVGTANGVCRFDGKEFETYRYDPKNQNAVGANEVMRIVESQNGNVWIGTDGAGLSVYDYHKDSFTSLRQNVETPDQGLAEDRIYNLLPEEDEMIIGYRAIGSGKGGLTIVTEDLKIKKHLLQETKDYAGFPMKVTRSLKDTQAQGIYWLGGRSFFKWDRSTDEIKEFTHPSFMPNLNSITGIIEHSDSTLLVSILFDGLWIFDKKSNQWLQKVHDQPVHSFLKDETGKIWLADANGMGWLDPDTYDLTYEITTAGDNSPFKEELTITKIFLIDNNFWLCTNKGLFCWIYSFQQFSFQRIKVGVDAYAYNPEFKGILSKNEWLFIDQKRGLFITDTLLQFIKQIPMPGEIGVRKVTFLNNKKDKIAIIGGDKGLFKWLGDDDQIEPIVLKNSVLDLSQIKAWSTYIDDYGNAWIGTQTSGLIQLNLKNNKFTQYLHNPKDSLSLCHDKYLFEIDKDQNNNLWICTDKGVSIINPTTEKFVKYPGLEKIKNFVVYSVAADEQQNVWIGTRDQGLFKYHLPTGELKNFSFIDGLLYNGVNEIILVDSILWLSTKQGLCKMNIHTEEIIGFDQKKGLFTNSLYNSKISLLPNGNIMLTYPNDEYFSVFQNEDLKSQFQPPDLVINSMSILSAKKNRTVITSSGSNIDLSADENYFAIDFKGIHLIQPRGIIYEYKMEGFDTDWIQAGKTARAVYTTLPGGDYHFKVRAANQDGVWSKVAILHIFLATPWYKTLWFYLLSLLVFIGLLLTIYKIRTNQIRKEENFKRQLAETEMKALRSQINPHFIFNCLNSIKGYIIENKIEDGTEYVGRFAQLIRMILNNSKRRLIPITKEVEALKLYTWLEQERLNQKFNVEFDLSFKSDQDALLIPPLLFQPFVENAIWHGLMGLNRKGNLIIKIEEKASQLVVQILDDGIGRTESMKQKQASVFEKDSLGLEISKGRLDQINKLYELESKLKIQDQFPELKETGTIVTIIFPIIKSKEDA